MRFLLRDINGALVEAWRQDFGAAADVAISHGDIFDLQADAIVSPANSFGFMDGGIDLVYSQKFGWDLQSRLRELLHADHDGELPVGEAVVVPTGDAAIPLLISAPTMRIPMDVSETLNAYLAFRAAIRAARRYNETAARPIESILCPGLGTAVGRLPPRACSAQMLRAYRTSHLRQVEKHAGLGDAIDDHVRMTTLTWRP